MNMTALDADGGKAKSEDSPSSRLVNCQSVEELFLPASRALIGSLCRPFLDQMALTPTELLYSPKNHSRIDGAGTLLRDATEKAAGLQAKAFGVKSYDRGKEIQTLLEQLSNLMRGLDEKDPVGALRPADFLDYVRQQRQMLGRDQAEMRIWRALTESLAGAKKWSEKLDLVMNLLRETAQSQDLAYADVLMAEIIASDIAQDALFGRRVSLEDRIDDLLDLYKGTYPGRSNIVGASPFAAELNGMLKDFYLPETKTAIETSVVQLLAARNPLRSPELIMELRALHGLLQRMRDGDRIIGGRRALEFIDKRQGRLLNEESVSDYIRGAGSLGERVLALLDIYAVTFGPNNKKVVETFINRYFADEDFERRLLVGEGAPQHKLRLLTNIHKSVLAAPFTPQERQAYANRVAQMQANFIANSRMFANIEKQNIGNAKKCIQIAQMCVDGLFIAGDNLERAKGLVRHYLTRPDFLERYFDGIPTPAGRKELMRELADMLSPIGIDPPAVKGVWP